MRARGVGSCSHDPASPDPLGAPLWCRKSAGAATGTRVDDDEVAARVVVVVVVLVVVVVAVVTGTVPEGCTPA